MHRLPYICDDRVSALLLTSGTERVGAAIAGGPERFASRFGAWPDFPLYCTRPVSGGALAVPTETLVVEGGDAAEVDWACRHLSLEVIAEGRHGRLLLRAVCEDGGFGRLGRAADAAWRLHRRGSVEVAHPNLLRLYSRPVPPRVDARSQWALDNDGSAGLAGADVSAFAAWRISRGSRRIRIAVLDDGVDLAHPYLRHAAAAERDFVADDRYGRPAGDDAHGTAVAGIVAADGPKALGLAPGVSLVAARIAIGGNYGYWISDDFETAEAIDWCVEEAEVDVLNLSWGGGPPADVITHALRRAATSGRGGRGAVVVAAAGNTQTTLDYPASRPSVIAVGASNAWDQRKTRRSRDGEDWWGSSYGENLSLLAPGVSILTTDLPGRRGFDPTLAYGRFGGTSASAAFVSAAAGLALSVNPGLSAAEIRRLLETTADELPGGRRSTHGHGRLDAHAALRRAGG